MIVYPKKHKKLFWFNEFYKNINGNVDNSLTPAGTYDAYNYFAASGALKDGFGVGNAVFMTTQGKVAPKIAGETIEKAYYYKRYDDVLARYDDRLIVYCVSGKLYEFNLVTGGSFTLLGATFDVAPQAVNYKLNGVDVLLLSCGGALKVYDGNTFSTYEAPDITSMCIHAERLFVTTGGEKTTLWFSDNFDPTNWYVSLSEAGFIDFQDGLGKVNKAINFSGYVYLFRDTGITRVKGYFDQQEFYTENVPTVCEKIIPSTVTDCGKCVIFMTGNGFYSFNGGYCTKIMEEITPFVGGVDNSSAKGAYFNGNFYCIVNVKIDKKVEKRIVCYNLLSKKFYFAKGVKVKDILPLHFGGERLLFVPEKDERLGQLSENCTFFGRNLKKAWVSSHTNFSLNGRKILSKLTVETKGRISVFVESEEGRREFTVDKKDSGKFFVVGLGGYKFTISIKSNELGTEVTNLGAMIVY